jgi:glycerol-3-phosphate O-acyltransferase
LNKLALETMVRTVFPYIEAELNITQDTSAIDRWLKHMVSQELLELHPAGGYCAPPPGDPKHNQLHLLASIITPTLERLYIVIGLLAAPGNLKRSRESLQEESRLVAHKMSRIYGMNAPEFFDARLFNLFIDKLILDGVVRVTEDGTLCHTPVVDDVLKAAKAVINPEFRYAILREG